MKENLWEISLVDVICAIRLTSCTSSSTLTFIGLENFLLPIDLQPFCFFLCNAQEGRALAMVLISLKLSNINTAKGINSVS